VERATADSLTVLFDAVGFKTFDLALVQECHLIEPMHDGEIAAADILRGI
jgi:hypothetical protein